MPAKKEDSKKTGKKRHRSPNHPMLSLPAALERTKVLLDKDGLTEIPINVAHERWGYKPHSAAGNQCVATLKSYGLLNVEGIAERRKVQVTEAGRRILKEAPDRNSRLRVAALEPQLHNELFQKYRKNGIPHDDVIRNYLLWEREEGTFNEDSVDSFISKFRETMAYAGLFNGDKIEDDNPPETNLEVGSYVQWTSQGADQFPEPRRVIEIHEDGEYAFVEGSQTGLPVSELTVTDPPSTPPAPPAQQQPPANPHYKPLTPPSKPINVLVGYTDDGEPIYATVSFDAPLRKGFLAKLAAQLESLESGASGDKKK